MDYRIEFDNDEGGCFICFKGGINPMNIVKYFLKLFCLVLVQTHIVLSAAQGQACTQVATVIFSQHLAKANIPASSKAQLQQILNNLYLGYLVRQNGAEVFGRSGTDPKMIDSYWQALKDGAANYDTNPFCLYTALKQSPKDIQDNKICIDTASLQAQPVNVANCQQNLKNMYQACGAYQLILKDFLNQIDPKSFQAIAADEQYQTNYVTSHLQKAVARLAATSSMVCNGMSCTPKFTGDVRDRGIIVNIQNNTQKNFAIVQSTVTGQDAKQIGMLKPGLNNVNLHLASLQAPNATPQTPSAYKLDVVAMDDNLSNDDQFSIKIMSGTELLTFLKSINKNPKGLFYMNGRLIAPKYAVDPKIQFLVLIKLPKTPANEAMAYDKAADQDFPIDQRIQCIALTNVNPYFITMQINEDEVEYETTKDAKTKSKAKILQPSFFSIQSLPGLTTKDSTTPAQQTEQQQPKSNSLNKNATMQQTLTNSLSPVILPDFLSDNVNLNVYTTILQTAYIASLTDFAFFDKKCFANDMMCYDLLGYFDKKNQRRFILNFYPLFITKKEMSDIRNIVESAIFESNVNSYKDIPSLYIYINGNERLIPNEIDYIFLNLEIKLNDFKNMNSLIEDKTFGNLYNIPLRNFLFIKLPEKKLKEDIFVSVSQRMSGGYEFIFKDRDGLIYGSYPIYPFKPIETIKVDFLDGDKYWIGSEVSQELINSKSKELSRFKFNYTYDSSKKQYLLNTSVITPIDRIKFKHTINFSEYPISDLYLDLYNTYEVSTIYRCIITENGTLPSFLQSLSQDDWTKGVYMITEITNNDKLSPQNPGELTITFYQVDGKTKLGQIILQGKSEATGKIGILEPIHAYNLRGKSFGTYYDIFLTTGILLQYKEKK